MAKAYNQGDLAEELGITRTTINRDMKYINEMTNKGLFDMAKTFFATAYFICVDSFGEIQRQFWKMYLYEENDPTIT